jgi:hypothetical protein
VLRNRNLVCRIHFFSTVQVYSSILEGLLIFTFLHQHHLYPDTRTGTSGVLTGWVSLSLSFEDWEFPSVSSMMEYCMCVVLQPTSVTFTSHPLDSTTFLFLGRWTNVVIPFVLGNEPWDTFIPTPCRETSFYSNIFGPSPIVLYAKLGAHDGRFFFQVFLIPCVWMSFGTNCGTRQVSADRHHPYLLFMCVKFWHLWSFVWSS